MNKVLLEKKINEEMKDLPSETLDEILDFVKFKKLIVSEREPSENRLKHELVTLSETSLTHLEKEFSGYKERYPRE